MPKHFQVSHQVQKTIQCLEWPVQRLSASSKTHPLLPIPSEEAQSGPTNSAEPIVANTTACSRLSGQDRGRLAAKDTTWEMIQ